MPAKEIVEKMLLCQEQASPVSITGAGEKQPGVSHSQWKLLLIVYSKNCFTIIHSKLRLCCNAALCAHSFVVVYCVLYTVVCILF